MIDGGPVIAYCRIGERSAHTWFVLHELLGEERRQELRRLVDRVGQPGRRADREGRLGACSQRAGSSRSRSDSHDPRGRSPDEVAVDRVGGRLDRHALAHQALASRGRAPGPAGDSSSTRATSVSCGRQARPGGHEAHEGVAPGSRSRTCRPAAARPPAPRAPRSRPISSSASRSAVSRRSSSGSSWRPPGNEISPACRRRSARRSVNTATSPAGVREQRHQHRRVGRPGRVQLRRPPRR